MKSHIMLVMYLLIAVLTVNGALVLNGTKLERVFNGIGGISGGGATSRFLPSYQEPYISQILDYLFLPNFGASLHMLKVEIGGDCQSTQGTESSHMHNRSDLSYSRGYEWWLMTEAKARNPDILLYALSWGVPGWIGGGKFYSQDNIDYHIKWLQGAKQVYGLDIDYIGGWNEFGYNITWTTSFRAQLNSSGFNNTQIVAADSGWNIVTDLQNNAQFKQAVAVVGVHYPGTTSPTNAQQLGTPLWASEDYSTFADSSGGGCWARILNQNYVNGYMTSTIAWNLIAAYYTNLPYPGTGLMEAEQPWSGHYDVQSPIWVSAHTTQFTKPGWIYLAHGSGTGLLPNGGSYVTLVPPNNTGGDFSLIIETMTHDHSKCIRPTLPSYNVTNQTVTFQLQGGLATNKTLYVWYTHLNQTQDNVYFEQIQNITTVNGQFNLSLDLDSVWTISTLTGQQKGSYPTPPAATNFPMSYNDSFEGYTVGQEANYFSDQTGVWEIYQGSSSLVMRQQVTVSPIKWCSAESNSPISLIGDFSSSDTVLTINAMIETSGTVGVGARVQNGGCGNSYAAGYFFFVSNSGAWTFAKGTTTVNHGTTTFSAGTFYTLGIYTHGANICVSINKLPFSCIQDSTWGSGFSSIGTGWNHAQFDNLSLLQNVTVCGSGSNVKVAQCGSTPYQSWNLSSDGTIQLLNTPNCLQVNGTDPNSGSPSVMTLPCNNTLPSQIWSYSGTIITSALNGYCLDITGYSRNICAAVEVYPCNGGLNQKWQLSGTQLTSALNSLCLAGNVA